MTTTESARIIDEVVRRYRPNPLHDSEVPQEWLTKPTLRLVGGFHDWRNDPATDKQLSYLRCLGHMSTDSMTKGEASDLIEQFKAAR